jgi:hypothetical protein
MSQLEALFGHRALAPGETTTITVQLKAGALIAALAAPQGFTVESPPVRIPELRQVCWRIRAAQASDGALRLKIGREDLERPVRAGWGMGFVRPTCSSAPMAFLRYGCELRSDSVESIHVDYSSRKIGLFGLEAHWLLWLALFWLAAMLLLRRRFGVTF